MMFFIPVCGVYSTSSRPEFLALKVRRYWLINKSSFIGMVTGGK